LNYGGSYYLHTILNFLQLRYSYIIIK